MRLNTIVAIWIVLMTISLAFSETIPAKPAKPVQIYMTDWCHYCREAQNYMKSRGIAFTAYDIEKDSAAHKRYIELGGGGVPILVIGSKKMYGFSKEKFEYILKQEN